MDDEIVTTEDVREHMRGTLELIAGTMHVHDGEPLRVAEPPTDVPWHDECPTCMAGRCLEQIDAAEDREGGLL